MFGFGLPQGTVRYGQKNLVVDVVHDERQPSGLVKSVGLLAAVMDDPLITLNLEECRKVAKRFDTTAQLIGHFFVAMGVSQVVVSRAIPRLGSTSVTAHDVWQQFMLGTEWAEVPRILGNVVALEIAGSMMLRQNAPREHLTEQRLRVHLLKTWGVPCEPVRDDRHARVTEGWEAQVRKILSNSVLPWLRENVGHHKN